MADLLKIDVAFKDNLTVHDDCCKNLGDQSQAELLQLAIHARKSNNPLLLRYFIDLPSMDELIAAKTTADLDAVKKNTVSATKEATPSNKKA